MWICTYVCVIGEDDFMTASEGEDDENEGERSASTSIVTKAPPGSTTKVLANFSLPLLSIEVTDESTRNNLRLELPTLCVEARVKSWSNSVCLSLASVNVEHVISGDRKINVLSTVGDENLLTIDLLQVSLCVHVYVKILI